MRADHTRRARKYGRGRSHRARVGTAYLPWTMDGWPRIQAGYFYRKVYRP